MAVELFLSMKILCVVFFLYCCFYIFVFKLFFFYFHSSDASSIMLGLLGRVNLTVPYRRNTALLLAYFFPSDLKFKFHGMKLLKKFEQIG